jgi:hypothetical protein
MRQTFDRFWRTSAAFRAAAVAGGVALLLVLFLPGPQPDPAAGPPDAGAGAGPFAPAAPKPQRSLSRAGRFMAGTTRVAVKTAEAVGHVAEAAIDETFSGAPTP